MMDISRSIVGQDIWDSVPGPSAPAATVAEQHHQLQSQQQSQQLQQHQPQNQQKQQQQQQPHQEMEKELSEWLRTEGVLDSVIRELEGQGFTSRRFFHLLGEQDVVDMGIKPLAQRKLLVDLIGAPGMATSSEQQTPAQLIPAQPNPTHSASSVPPVTTDGICGQLSDLFRSLPSTTSDTVPQQQQQQALNTAGEVATVNPFYHLINPSRPKYHQIVKFIRLYDEESVEEEVWGDGQRKLVFKAGTRTKKLQDVNPMQWCGANVRIMMELLREGELQPQSIPDYLAYTAKISDLASVYEWRSVLQYDDLYRRMQAENGFRWGSESPHVDRLCLRFKEKIPTTSEKKSSRLCINFQFSKCTRGQACNYRHVCSAPGCGKKDHGLADHEKNTGN